MCTIYTSAIISQFKSLEWRKLSSVFSRNLCACHTKKTLLYLLFTLVRSWAEERLRVTRSIGGVIKLRIYTPYINERFLISWIFCSRNIKTFNEARSTRVWMTPFTSAIFLFFITVKGSTCNSTNSSEECISSVLIKYIELNWPCF